MKLRLAIYCRKPSGQWVRGQATTASRVAIRPFIRSLYKTFVIHRGIYTHVCAWPINTKGN